MCSLYIICILLIISFRGYRNRMLTWNGLIHYKAWTLILHKFKSSGCFGDGSSLWQWFWLEVRLHALWLVNHSTKTIHHHRYLLVQRQQWKYPKTEIHSKLRKKTTKKTNYVEGIVLMSWLLTSNIFYTSFLCFHCDVVIYGKTNFI